MTPGYRGREERGSRKESPLGRRLFPVTAACVADLERLHRERFVGFRCALATITGSPASAEDALQEAFVRALLAIDTYRGEAPLAAWVWRIAVNVAVEQRRGQQRREKREASAAVAGSAPDDRLEQINAAMRQLPPRRRLIAFLRYFAECSYAEIAAICEVSEGTVAASLAQAREALAAELGMSDREAAAQEVHQ